MKIDQELLRKTAHLARLSLSPAEEAEIQADLEQILNWMDLLNQVDTEGIEPLMHMTEATNRFREDIAQPALDKKSALSQAPNQDGDYFLVPKVIE
jgi:aspartyl-tRNA(Asn)/glutamyl-tRNA(Gln) amidotransferase subunit C